jgi:hypothetical protein
VWNPLAYDRDFVKLLQFLRAIIWFHWNNIILPSKLLGKFCLPTYIRLTYGNMGCRVFKRGIQHWKDLCLKINIPQGNYWILRIGVYGEVSKIGHCFQGCIRRGDLAPKFSDTLTLSQPGGQILPTIAEVEPKFSPWLRPWF